MIIDKDNIKLLLVILVVALGIGYAYINSDLNINGTAKIKNANWDVHWANVQIKSGSVTGDNVVTEPTIDTNQTTVAYSVVLPTPGTYYEFTVDAVNAGSIDAMIDTIDSKLNGATITTLPDYLDYTVTYSDGVALEQKHLLSANTTETYKVKIKYRDDIELSQIPASDQTLSLEFTVTYRQATEDSETIPHPVSFADDSWDTIVAAVQSGNTSNYNVGDTKEIDMGTFGTHTLRIANKSTPSECSTTGFSQTACGFVLEFVDIIAKHRMNPFLDTLSNGDGNVGGWKYSDMGSYVNNEIYISLPTDLKNAIVSTSVVSSHGNRDSANFTNSDKLYLLSTHEVWEDVDGNVNAGISRYDTSYNQTRQLDYYSTQSVTTSNYSSAIKQYNGTNSPWWLRSAASNDYDNFYNVNDNGSSSLNYTVLNTLGVAPAFRIA